MKLKSLLFTATVSFLPLLHLEASGRTPNSYYDASFSAEDRAIFKKALGGEVDLTKVRFSRAEMSKVIEEYRANGKSEIAQKIITRSVSTDSTEGQTGARAKYDLTVTPEERAAYDKAVKAAEKIVPYPKMPEGMKFEFPRRVSVAEIKQIAAEFEAGGKSKTAEAIRTRNKLHNEERIAARSTGIAHTNRITSLDDMSLSSEEKSNYKKAMAKAKELTGVEHEPRTSLYEVRKIASEYKTRGSTETAVKVHNRAQNHPEHRR